MRFIDIINNVFQIAFFNVVTYFVALRLINYRQNNYKNTITVVVISIIEGFIGTIASEYILIFPSLIIVYLIHSLLIKSITKNKLMYSIIVTFIALTMTYLVYAISILLAGILLKAVYPNIEKTNIIILICVMLIEIVILYRFFKIKRFKNGFSFLQNKERVNSIGVIGVAFIGVALLLFSLFDTSRGEQFITYLTIGLLIEAVCMTIWIRRKITKHYRQNLRKNEIQELENEIKEKDEEISKILKENKTIATINHKYSSRIKALEKISAKILSKPEIIEKMKTEFGEEFGELQEQINKISEEYTNEVKEKIEYENKLDKTGIFGIDNLLEYLKEEAEKEDIKLELKINGSINYMIEKVIKQNGLETLLGDHIKDAIIAIQHSNNTHRSILVVIGIIDECYEVKIYDTGIEFEIATLLKLGTEEITTHKETGGSGIGFMTTFETLKETKASLIIEEKHPMSNNDYTKSVAIRFDGKNEYRIKSYRAKEIRKVVGERKIKVV